MCEGVCMVKEGVTGVVRVWERGGGACVRVCACSQAPNVHFWTVLSPRNKQFGCSIFWAATVRL